MAGERIRVEIGAESQDLQRALRSARDAIGDVGQAARRLDGTKAEVRADADTAAAQSKLAALDKAAEAIEREIELDVDVDQAQAIAKLKLLQREADKTRRELATSSLGLSSLAASATRAAVSTGGLSRSLGRTNTVFTFLRNHLRAIGFGALTAGVVGLTAAAIALTSALGPVVGNLAAIPGAATSVVQAMSTVKLATAGVGDALGGLNEPLDRTANSFKQLTPEARRFTTFLQSMKPEVQDLQRTAQRGLLPGVERGIRSASRNFPVLDAAVESTSEALGGLAAQAGRSFGSRGWARDLEIQGRRNTVTIDRLGRSGLHLTDALRHVTIAAGPLVDWLTRLTLGWSKSAEEAARAGRQTGELEQFLERTRRKTVQLASILGNLSGTLFNVGSASVDSGNSMLRSIDRTTAAWERWTGSLEGQATLASFFDDAKDAMGDVLDAIGDVVERFHELRQEGKTTGEALAIMLTEGIEKALPKIANLAGRSAGTAAKAFLQGWLASDTWGKLFTVGLIAYKMGAFGAAGRKGASLMADALKKRLAGGAAAEAGATAAGSIVGGLRVRMTALRGRIGDLFKRIFTRVGLVSGGVVATSTAAGVVGGEAAGGGIAGALRSKWGKLKSIFQGVFRRLGVIAGGAAAVSTAAGVAGGEAAGAGLAGAFAARQGRFKSMFKRVGGRWGKFLGAGILAGILLALPGIVDTVSRELTKALPFLEQYSGSKGWGNLGNDVLDALPIDRENFFDMPWAKGGIVGSSKRFSDLALGFARGGMVPGTGNTDTVPSMLTPGELVVPKDETNELLKGGGLAPRIDVKPALEDLALLSAGAEDEAAATADALRKHLRAGQTDGGRFITLFRREALADLRDFRRGGEEHGREFKRELLDHLGETESRGTDHISGLRRGAAGDIESLRRSADRDFSAMERTVDRKSADMEKDATRHARAMDDGVSRSVEELQGAVYKGFSYVAETTDKALKSFDVKPVSLNVPKPKKLEQGGVAGDAKLAHGGYAGRAGARGRDKPAPWVGDGELVSTAHQQPHLELGLATAKALGVGQYGSVSELLRGEQRPHYMARGGIAGAPERFAAGGWSGASAGGLNEAVKSIGLYAMQRYGATATSTTGGGHAPGSYHYSGDAVDLVSGDIPRMQSGLASHFGIPKFLELFGPAPWYVKDGVRQSGAFPDHGDHVHAAAVGKALAGAVTQIPRVLVEGTEGPLRDMAQAAIDMARKGANAYISDHMPTTAEGSYGAASGNVEAIFADVIRQFTAPFTAGLALMEAGWAESGMKNIDYGDASSQGPLQLLSSTAAGLGVDPNDVGAVASLFMTKGFYGRGGALDLVSQNPSMPAHMVAQSVQGSAFSSGSNYAAQEGAAKASLRRQDLYASHSFARGGIAGDERRRDFAVNKRELERTLGRRLEDLPAVLTRERAEVREAGDKLRSERRDVRDAKTPKERKKAEEDVAGARQSLREEQADVERVLAERTRIRRGLGDLDYRNPVHFLGVQAAEAAVRVQVLEEKLARMQARGGDDKEIRDAKEELERLRDRGAPRGRIRRAREELDELTKPEPSKKRVREVQDELAETRAALESYKEHGETLKGLLGDAVSDIASTVRLGRAQAGVMADFRDEYVGQFAHGGRVVRTGVAIVHQDEEIVPDPDGPYGSRLARGGGGERPVQVELVFKDKAGALVELVDARVDQRAARVVSQQVGRRQRIIATANGRGSR